MIEIRRKQIFEPSEMPEFTKYLKRWLYLLFFAGVGAHFLGKFGLSFHGTKLYLISSFSTPAIRSWVEITNYKDAAAAMWVIGTYAGPFVICTLFRLANPRMASGLREKFFYIPVFVAMSFISASYVITGTLFGLPLADESGFTTSARMRVYQESLFGTLFYCELMIGSFTWLVPLLLKFFVLNFKPKTS